MVRLSSGLKRVKCPVTLTGVQLLSLCQEAVNVNITCGKPLWVVLEESNLELTVSTKVKLTKHKGLLVKKAYTVLEFIAMNFE